MTRRQQPEIDIQPEVLAKQKRRDELRQQLLELAHKNGWAAADWESARSVCEAEADRRKQL